MNMLPAKQASSEEKMNATRRMSLQEMMKAAAQGVANNASLQAEAARQRGEVQKIASVEKAPQQYSGEYVEKLAQAVEYILEQDKQANEVGEGPGALAVSEARGGTNAIDAGQTGEAHMQPTATGTMKDPTRKSDPGTGLENNLNEPLKTPYPTKLSSMAAPLDLIRKVAGSRAAAKEEPKKDEKKSEEKVEEKKASDQTDMRLVDFVLAQKKLAGESIKQAEDAINPAHISAGPAVPPETSQAGEQGGAPVGGQPEGSRSLVGSNESAINYTKGEAKSSVKKDMKAFITEPAQTSATDSVLQKALEHTGQAGVKISSEGPTKTAAARALLEKLASEAEEKAKKKTSTMGPGTYQAPQVGGVAQGAM